MNINFEKASEILTDNNIRPSHQRVMIYSYFASNFNHPTAHQIYSSLKKSIPTLSKSTVYSTLKTFIHANLIREITIEENEIRYDFNMQDHGHFRCDRCEEIYDFEIEPDGVLADGLSGFLVNDKNVFYKGVCKDCLNKENRTKT